MRTPWLVLVLLVHACGKQADDHAGKAAGAAPSLTPPTTSPAAENGPPPKETYRGKVRLVNLYLDKAGKPQSVDVWVRRGFKYGPVKLAENIVFGAASEWFGVPEHMSPVVLPAGAKPDDKELTNGAAVVAGEVATEILAADHDVPVLWIDYEVSKTMTQTPKPPAVGKGLVVLNAKQLSDYDKPLADKFGGRSFNVGNGTADCAAQRQDPKFAPAILGGTQPVQLELPPGAAKITLHKWPSHEGCKSPSLMDIAVDVKADVSQWIILFTPDAGKTIATLALPFGS